MKFDHFIKCLFDNLIVCKDNMLKNILKNY